MLQTKRHVSCNVQRRHGAIIRSTELLPWDNINSAGFSWCFTIDSHGNACILCYSSLVKKANNGILCEGCDAKPLERSAVHIPALKANNGILFGDDEKQNILREIPQYRFQY